jgi:hypothetical protein
MKMVLSAIVAWMLAAAVGCNTQGTDVPASDPARTEQSPPTVVSGRTVPATEVLDVVNSLMHLTGTKAKMDVIVKNTVKEFNEKHAGDRLVLKFGITDIRPEGPVYCLDNLQKAEIPKGLCQRTWYKMPLTEQEILAIEKPKPGENPTSFLELSGMCRLLYGGVSSWDSNKPIAISTWRVPENGDVSSLSLFLDNPTAKLIVPPH